MVIVNGKEKNRKTQPSLMAGRLNARFIWDVNNSVRIFLLGA